MTAEVRLDFITGRVIRWEGEPDLTLEDELRARPGHWATVGEYVTGAAFVGEHTPWRDLRDTPGFMFEMTPMGTGMFKKLYRVRACYVEEKPDE